MVATCTYPVPPKSGHVDTYHGVEVSDPFRPLEEASADRTAWIEAQNELTVTFTQNSLAKPAIEAIANRIWKYPGMTLPQFRGDRWMSIHSDGESKQTRIVSSRRLTKKIPWRPVVDPNSWSKSGTVGVNNCIASPDGKLVMYSFSWGGQDHSEWRIAENDTRANRPDIITANSQPLWNATSNGVFVFEFVWVTTVDGGKATAQWEPRIRYHALGTSFKQDYYVAKGKTGRWLKMQAAADKFLLFSDSASAGSGGPTNLLAVATDAREAQPFVVAACRPAVYKLICEVNGIFYLLTDLDAPRSRLVAIDLKEGPQAQLREVIAEKDEVLNACVMIGDRFVADYLDGPVSKLKILGKSGCPERQVELPAPGTIRELKPAGQKSYLLYQFDSTALPPRSVKVDVRTGKQRTLFEHLPPGFDVSRYQTSLYFAVSKDGTKVPIVIVHKKGVVWDGSNPTYMHGYGGFGTPVRPGFAKTYAVWLEMGGVFASVSTRGGGEYGQAWHQAGTQLNKQNVFDDFIAAAEWLIESRLTSSKRLAIGGGSNGGLLVAACMLQRPDLFGAVVCQAAVLDMLRYHLIKDTKAWEPDYGTSDNEAQFKVLRSISPVHNVSPSAELPAVLVTAGARDDRVDFSHSLKFLAALQEAQSGGQPILGAIEMATGHGIGTDPVDMQIRNCVRIWIFVAEALAMKIDGHVPLATAD